jgi:hypothetical protein
MLQALSWHLFGKWMWDVFRHGPAVFGGWAGLADEEVCARIASNTHASDWMTAGRPSDTCTAMLSRAFAAFCVPLHTLLYVACVWACAKWMLERAHMRALARRVALELHNLREDPGLTGRAHAGQALQVRLGLGSCGERQMHAQD